MTETTIDWEAAALPLVTLALEEDLGAAGDVTTRSIVPPTATATARIVARAPGVLAGLEVARLVFARVDDRIVFAVERPDGAALVAGDRIVALSGPAAGLLAAERTALNFLQRLSGVATQTARYVAAVAGTGVRIVDTRKTTPGYRRLEKAAVLLGGGGNHRFGLHDRILIKDNHEVVAGGIAAAIRRARARGGALLLEVEVRTIDQFDEALGESPDIIMLDNMAPHVVAEVVSRLAGRADRPRIEVSGGITLATIREYAIPGVDDISIGALTHSAPALDLALDFDGILP